MNLDATMAGTEECSTQSVKLSVALCTYNGARFLGEQLDSISAQSRLPDELVVCDDCSSDNTREILESFKQTADFQVVLYFHDQNLGSTANFQFAVEHTRGEVIALADQDDRWNVDKLKLLEQTLESFPDALLVYSDANMVDQNMKPLGYRLWEAVGLNSSDRDQLAGKHATDLLLKKFAITGMTMAFRRSHLPLVLPIQPSWIHDGWIAFCLAAVGRLVCVEQPLVDYRQHESQQVGEKRRNLWQTYKWAKKLGTPHMRKQLEMYSEMLIHLKQQEEGWDISANLVRRLELKVAHLKARLKVRSSWWKRPSAFAIWASGDYRTYSFGWKSLVQDLIT